MSVERPVQMKPQRLKVEDLAQAARQGVERALAARLSVTTLTAEQAAHVSGGCGGTKRVPLPPVHGVVIKPPIHGVVVKPPVPLPPIHGVVIKPPIIDPSAAA